MHHRNIWSVLPKTEKLASTMAMIFHWKISCWGASFTFNFVSWQAFLLRTNEKISPCLLISMLCVKDPVMLALWIVSKSTIKESVPVGPMAKFKIVHSQLCLPTPLGSTLEMNYSIASFGNSDSTILESKTHFKLSSHLEFFLLAPYWTIPVILTVYSLMKWARKVDILWDKSLEP